MSESSTKPAVQDGLAFERPLNDLQTKIDELRKPQLRLAPRAAGRDRAARGAPQAPDGGGLRRPVAVGARQRRAPRRPPADAGLHHDDARRLRRAARRSPLRRRPRDHLTGLATMGRAPLPAGRPPQGQDGQGPAGVQLRLRAPRGLPEGPREDEARPEAQHPDHHVHQHARRLSGNRC